MKVTNLLDIHTREELYAWYLANHDTAKDFWLRVNRANAEYPGVIRYVDAVEVALCFGWIDSTQKRIDDGKPVQHFTPRRKGCNWCEQNIERCRRLWKNFQSFPENYRRIKLDRIQHYRNTSRIEQAETALKNFIRDCHNGKMSPNWSDFGRLENCGHQRKDYPELEGNRGQDS